MQLPKILAVCGVLNTVDAAFFKRTRFARSTGSDHILSTLSLVASLQPINATHVDVSITNTYSQQISILNWNNHFQTNQNAAHGSFQVTHIFPNGSKQTLGRGPLMGHYRFAETVPSHFFNITAGSIYTDTFDLTKLFNVPEADTYNVTMDFTSPATFVADGTDLSAMLQKANRRKSKNHAQNLPKVRIKSNTISMNLQASPPIKSPRKRNSNAVGTCSSQPQAATTIIRARGNARSLAKFSQEAILPPSGISAHGVSAPLHRSAEALTLV